MTTSIGPPPARTGTMLRRLLALTVLVALIGGLGWLAFSLVRDGRTGADTQTPTEAVPPLQVLRIVFPEGFTRAQMAEQITAVNGIAKRKRGVTPRISPERYLALTAEHPFPGRFVRDRKPRSLEGFLFPATYEFTARTTAKEMAAKQLAAFRANWAKVDLRYAKSKNLTPFEVLIIASLVEKEVAAPEERAKVASVIYNRLKAGMRLDIDATTRYALDVPATEPLLQSQLDDPHPYNLRKHFGLTPGPIANPGLASMQAAAHPKQTDFLYFIRKPDKRHHAFFTNQRDFDNYQREHGF